MPKNHDKKSEWASMSVQDVIAHLQSDAVKGLTAAQARERLSQYGVNEATARQEGLLTMIVHQIKSPLIYLLSGVAIISFISQGAFEGCMILAIMAINILLGLYQEYNASTELRQLKQYIRGTVLATRDGKQQEIDARNLVPGDLISLAPGDIVHADMRIIQSEGLTIDEAVLTGESYAQIKNPEPIKKTSATTIETVAFSGTSVVSGYGQGIVTATGDATLFGNIAHLALETQKTSSFVQELSRVSNFIVRLVMVCLVCVVMVQLLIKGSSIDFLQLAIFACALAVSIIPNALPLVVTFALSRGALTLAHKKVVVKRLESIEDLGNMDILCVDKTGTLTENKLSFLDACTLDEKQSVVLYGALPTLLSSGQKMFGGFDQACYDALSDTERARAGYQLVNIKPFDPQKLFASYTVTYNHTKQFIIQGAPEDIAHRCQNADTTQCVSWLAHHAALGSRVIALAYKAFEETHTIIDDETEKGFILLGYIAFTDPIRDTAAKAVNRARSMGVTIKVLSGDRKEVCGTVAHTIGLIEDPNDVITGDEYARLDEKDKRAAAKRYTVFARVYPQQKHELITYLQEDGVVGYLGDGVNDAPALRKAHVAITVQGATDIARGEADIILLKKSLMVIIDGIAEGRKIFVNSAKYIRITLASNVGNFFSIAIASLMLDFLPMLPIQLLLGDLLSDLPMMAIATDSVDTMIIKRPRHYNVTSLFTFIMIMGIVSTSIDILFFVRFKHYGAHTLQTSWFIMSCLTEIIAIFSLRTDTCILRATLPSLPIILLSAGALTLATVLPFVHVGHTMFDLVALSQSHVIMIYLFGVGYLVANEIAKKILRRVQRNGATASW